VYLSRSLIIQSKYKLVANEKSKTILEVRNPFNNDVIETHSCLREGDVDDAI
jgi:hypothetical protein